jgi:hypothetical protein
MTHCSFPRQFHSYSWLIASRVHPGSGAIRPIRFILKNPKRMPRMRRIAPREVKLLTQ